MTDRELIARLVEALEKVIKAEWMVTADWSGRAERDVFLDSIHSTLALAHQHNGGWRHLDRDEEKPEDDKLCLVHGDSICREKAIYNKELNRFHGQFRGCNPRWWQPLPSPPKETE